MSECLQSRLILAKFKSNFSKFVLFLLLFLSNFSFGQLDSIHYFPAFHSRQNSQIAEQYVYLSTPEPTPFLVTLVDGNGATVATATISQDNPASIFIGSGQFPGTEVAVPHDSLATVLRASGFIASAPYDFYCNVRIKAAQQATSIACKGRAALGKQFYTGSMPQMVSNTNRNFVTSIMATENGTVVSVSGYNPAVIFEAPAGLIYADALTIFLNAGDTYVLSGYTTATTANMNGFIGARISSNKNIAVNTGNYMGSIHSEGFQDGGMVQIVPIQLLGTEHVVVEGQGGPIMERPLVVATVDGTAIYINDILTPVATINEGDYYLVPESYYSGTLHKNMVIKTSQPAYVYQCTAANTSSATSEFNFIPPLECYLTDFIDAIPDIDRIGPTIFDGKLYIITVTGAVVTVNGSVLGGAAGPEPAIGLPEWETYKLDMIGDVTVNSTGAMAAGFIAVNGNAAAGAYYAGFSFDYQVDAGPDLELCSGEEALLFGTGAGIGGIYTWDYGVLDSIAFTPGTTITYTVIGTDFEGCEDDDTVVVTVYEHPTSFAGFDLEVCDTNTVALAGNTPLVDSGFGTWTVLSGPGSPTFDDDTSPTAEITGLFEGVYELVWTVGNGTCPTIEDTMTITVYNQPISNAGPDQDLCNSYTTALNGNVMIGSTSGVWTCLSGPSIPTFSDPTNAYSLFTDLVEGTYTLAWTMSNGVCIDSVDTVLINVYDSPISNAGEDQELCGLTETTLEGNIPLGTSTGLWAMESGPAPVTFSVATDPVTTITDLIEGTYILVWTVSNGTCTPTTDTAVINIYDLPISNAGPDQSLCETDASALLGNSPAGSSSGEWTQASGPTAVVFDDSTDPLTTINGLAIGTYELVWTVSNGSCDAVTDTIQILIKPYPIVDFNANKLVGCAPLGVAFINLSSPMGDDCLWEFGDGDISTDCGDNYHIYTPGVYDVTLTVTVDGCTASETRSDYITSVAIPEANFAIFPDVINITNTTVDFTNFSTNSSLYSWNFGDGTSSSSEFEPTHTYPEIIGGVYEVILIAQNEYGCADTAYKTVAYEDIMIFYIPNAFTPDATGINDKFSPVFTSRVDPDHFNLKIFNRWGEIIFESYDINIGWDGTYNGVIVQDGVYIWSIEFKDTLSDKKYDYRGHVTIFK